jgi:hypothetical protein
MNGDGKQLTNGSRHIEDFYQLLNKLRKNQTFTFVRFSDGEIEILNDSKFHLGESGISWSRGISNLVYPNYDHKNFDPALDSELKRALVLSAKYSSTGYIKGIPARHNKSPQSTDLMRKLNGYSDENLTFADLFMNANYKKFLSEFLPELIKRDDVALVGNFRMSTQHLNPKWTHIKIPDHAFAEFPNIVDRLLVQIEALTSGGIVLCSASSLSNILGHRLHEAGGAQTFIDIGTTLHPQAGMSDSLREYQSQLLPWSLDTVRRKALFLALGRRKFRW